MLNLTLHLMVNMWFLLVFGFFPNACFLKQGLRNHVVAPICLKVWWKSSFQTSALEWVSSQIIPALFQITSHDSYVILLVFWSFWGAQCWSQWSRIYFVAPISANICERNHWCLFHFIYLIFAAREKRNNVFFVPLCQHIWVDIKQK